MVEARTFPMPEHALGASISDGDFRTYAIIWRLAWHQNPDADTPYIEMSLQELASHHPGPLSPETVRGRVHRMARVGLLRRERCGRTGWRTYLILDRPDIQSALADQTIDAQAERVVADPSAPAATQADRGQANTVRAVVAYPKLEAALAERTQTGGENTERSPGTRLQDDPVSTQPRPFEQVQPQRPLYGTMLTLHNSAYPRGAADDHGPAGATCQAVPERAGTARSQPLGAWQSRAPSDLTDLDLMSGGLDLEKLSKQVKAVDRQRSLGDGLAIDPIHRPLAVALANLTPEPMTAQGILECLQEPGLTAAWLDYVVDPTHNVHKPAAYLRQQVRRGYFPPDQRQDSSPRTSDHGRRQPGPMSPREGYPADHNRQESAEKPGRLNGKVSPHGAQTTDPGRSHETIHPAVASLASRCSRWPLDVV